MAVVADGMGGHLAGDMASQMTTQYIEEQMKQRLQPGMLQKASGVSGGQRSAKPTSKSMSLSSTSEQVSGMGTTVVRRLQIPEHVDRPYRGQQRLFG